MNDAVYLARQGKGVGPFSEREFEAMKANGSLREYTWIWSWDDQQWKPLDPPPPPLIVQAAPPAATSPREKRAEPSPLLNPDAIVPIEAICHDRSSAITGAIRKVTAVGCELSAHHSRQEPPFSEKAAVVLNLLDPRTGRSVDVRAQIAGISRKEGHWTYRILWDACPELVSSAAR